MKNGRVVFLGTGDAFSAGGHLQAAYLVELAGESLLLDCGPAALAALQRHGLAVGLIDTVVLTHFHGDHFAGLPFLFLYYAYVEPRNRPLRIIGPPGVESRVMGLFAAMYSDSASEPLPYAIEFLEVESGRPIMAGEVSVEPFAVPHQKTPPSFGYVIEGEGRKIVYTGDTGWTEELVERAQGSDLFICECSFFETRLETHLDYPRIAENAARFGCRRMVLTHLGQEVLDRREEVGLEMAHDGLEVSLER